MATAKKKVGKVAEKVGKVAEKVGKAKAKIAKKCGKAAKALLLALAFAGVLCGCATSEPASRATCARYEFGTIKIDNGSTFTLTLGDGAIASADSTGSTETMTSSPTNDVKPDIDVSVPVNKAGAGQSVGSVIGDAVAGLIKGASARTTNSTATGAQCEDGSCSVGGGGACADGNCSE